MCAYVHVCVRECVVNQCVRARQLLRYGCKCVSASFFLVCAYVCARFIGILMCACVCM